MLDFERDDGEEADEIAEEDLIFLKDPCTQLDLIVLTSCQHVFNNDYSNY